VSESRNKELLGAVTLMATMIPDIVFLTGIKSGSQACTLNNIYVGRSRGRFLLYIFHEEWFSFG